MQSKHAALWPQGPCRVLQSGNAQLCACAALQEPSTVFQVGRLYTYSGHKEPRKTLQSVHMAPLSTELSVAYLEALHVTFERHTLMSRWMKFKAEHFSSTRRRGAMTYRQEVRGRPALSEMVVDIPVSVAVL
eukprot:1138489-Pelagomonas_calceolata.AAC.1